MEKVETSEAKRPQSGAGLKYRPSRANFSTALPFDHLHTAARRAGLAEAGLEAANSVAYEWDFASDRMSWSGPWRSLSGQENDSAPASGAALAAGMCPADRTHRYEAMFGSADTDEGEGIPYRLRFRLTDGTEIFEHGRWHTDDEGRPEHARGLLKRLGDPVRSEKGPAPSRSEVPDTGGEAILSRTGLTAALGREIGQSVRTGGATAFLLVGIDRLSTLNRAYGFEVADRLIETVWQRIRATLPLQHVVGHYTGNKLGIVLARGNEVSPELMAGRILAAINDEPLATENGPVPATVSIGGVSLPAHANSAEMAMLRAEEALGAARELPAPGYVAFAPSAARDETRARNLVLADTIISGLNDRRFHLHFQPVVSAVSTKAEFYECLLRLTEPDGSVTSAGAFMQAAEDLGLARLLDHRVLELVLEELRRHPDLTLSLNVSPLTAVSPDWLRSVEQAVGRRPDIARRMIVEITETVAIEDIDAAVNFVKSLRRAGCRVAMDDFGAGYTSFRNLKLLDIDIVKIDGGFVRELTDNSDDQVFVRSLIDLAGNFGIETVAECVEREVDADLLASWGVGCFQGYFYGRPGPDLPAPAYANGGNAAPEDRAGGAR